MPFSSSGRRGASRQMKWEDEDKGYPALSALSALNLNLDLNPAVRPRYYGFCWGLVADYFTLYRFQTASCLSFSPFLST
jgi:hypothetical protein